MRDTVPAAVEQVIARALAKVPADRFASATEFSAALDGAVTSGRIPAALPRFAAHRRAGVLAAVLALFVAAGGWWLSRNALADSGRLNSLVVLPFDNLSRDTAQEYFVAGMHDALISELAQISALRVISRTSALRYKDSRKTLPEIARELNVRGVVEGSVFRSGDSVRIQVRLIHALPTERHLLTRAHSRDLRDVLALHRDVARAIAREIEVALAPEEARRLASARPVNSEAYEDYLKGKFHAYRFSPQDLDIALEYFESALEKDPAYALAYVGIAVVWSGRQQMGFVPPREAAPKARAAVLRALELDSTLAEAHFALAGISGWHDWEWQKAEASFRRVIALNPNYPDPRVFYSLLLNAMGRSAEAMVQIERALALDPFNSFFRTMYGVNLLFVRRYDEAIAQFRNVLETDPNHLPALFNLHVAFHQKGMYEQALAQARTIYVAMGDREVEEALARGYGEGGYRVAMRSAAETLAARSRTTYVLPFDVAALYRFAGDHDQALNWLEKAYEARDPNLPFLGSPDWEGLRGHPRFQALVRRLKLPI